MAGGQGYARGYDYDARRDDSLGRADVPGPDALVCVFAFLMFVLALSCEHEDSLVNILLALAMYFTYCQMWIPLVARAFYDDFVTHRPMKWAKTERFDVGNGSGLA